MTPLKEREIVSGLSGLSRFGFMFHPLNPLMAFGFFQ